MKPSTAPLKSRSLGRRQRLQERLKARVEAVKTAWKRGLAFGTSDVESAPQSAPQKLPAVGLLIPVSQGQPTLSAKPWILGLGEQNLLGQQWQVGRAEVIRPEAPSHASRRIYHGDVVEVDQKRFRMALLPAKAFVQWFCWVIVLASGLAEGTPVDQEPPAAQVQPPVAQIHLPDAIPVLYRGRFEIPVVLPGIVRERDFSEASLVVKGAVDGGEIRLPIRGARPVHTDYMVIVDQSALCLKWEREEAINRQLRQLAAEAPGSSTLTVVGVASRPQPRPGLRSELDWKVVVPRTPMERWQPRDVIECRPGVESVNIFESVIRSKTLWLEMDRPAAAQGTRETGGRVRRVLVLYTPGNARVLPGAREVVEEFDLDVVPIVYANFQSPTLIPLVQPWMDQRDGRLLWWADLKPRWIESLPIAWTLEADFRVPYTWEERPYTAELRLPRGRWRFDVQYFRDPRAYFLYRAAWILGGLLVAAVAFLGVRGLIRRYRTPRCRKTGQVLSHTWKGSLFAAQGRWPLLVVHGPWGYERAIVLDQKRIRIGQRWGADVRLESEDVMDRVPLTVERVGYESYLVSRKAKSGHMSYGLSGVRREAPLFLKHGDRLSYGPYTLWFLHPWAGASRSK